jgi:hypothetical protein
MKKIDLILAGIIGFLNGIFFWFILWQTGKNLPYDIPNWTLVILFPPLGAFGIYVSFVLGKKISLLYQAAKFFLVGTLNTFIDLGVVNLLIWIFNITSGFFYGVFKAISFLTATTNSY